MSFITIDNLNSIMAEMTDYCNAACPMCNRYDWNLNLNLIKGVTDLKKWLRIQPHNYENLQNSFIEFNTKLDHVRKEKFDSVFPEYATLFK
jgi:hypothetical protein